MNKNLKLGLFGLSIFAGHFIIGGIVHFALKLQGISASLVMWSTMILMAILFSNLSKFRSIGEALKSGIIWLILYIILDYSIIIQVLLKGNMEGFYNKNLFIGYLLLLVTPILFYFSNSKRGK